MVRGCNGAGALGRVVVCATALLGLAALPSAAQSVRPERPYEGIFASGPDRDQRLDAMWSVFGVYDDNVTADTASYDPRYQVNGTYGLAAGSMSYVRQDLHGSLAVDGHLSSRYYSNLSQLSSSEGAASLTFAHAFGSRRRTSVNLFQSAQYLPYYRLAVLGEGTPSASPVAGNVIAPPSSGISPDTALTAMTTYGFDGRVQVIQRIAERSSIAADYGYRYTHMANVADPFRWQLANARFTSGITRYLSLRLGYGYGLAYDGFHPEQRGVVNQNLDLGVDYARPLSRSRRTRVAFSSGTTMVSYQGQTWYEVIGDGTLTREFGRTWNTSLNYHRGVQYVEGVAAPLNANTIQLRLAGLPTRRLQTSLQAAYSLGQVGFGATASDYTSASAIANVRFAINRMFQLESEYGYYLHDFQHSAVIAPFVPMRLERQSIRFGITGWLPVYRSRNPPPRITP